MEFKSKHGKAVAELAMLKLHYSKPENREGKDNRGWDRQLQARLMDIMIDYCGVRGHSVYQHFDFLDAMIALVERQDQIDTLINPEPKPKAVRVA